VRASVVIVNKHEAWLAQTLDAIGPPGEGNLAREIVVVDASAGALDWIRARHPQVRWIDFEPRHQGAITIAHQRNIGVRAATGDVIVFTDSGCIPEDHWLERLLAPIIEQGESVTCGPARAGAPSIYSGARWWGSTTAQYVNEAATINLAFRRGLFDAVGGFDESFGAAEDLDFTWRLRRAGYRLRWVPDAVVCPQWGGLERQLRRSLAYGRGWARLLRKHRRQIPSVVVQKPVPFVYPLFILGLPLAWKWRAYPALLLLPLWRARREARPWLIVVDHLVLGAGVLMELVAPGK
jgi:GT2 family glycosyltransferase